MQEIRKVQPHFRTASIVFVYQCGYSVQRPWSMLFR
jgi:hypothetical protein